MLIIQVQWNIHLKAFYYKETVYIFQDTLEELPLNKMKRTEHFAPTRRQGYLINILAYIAHACLKHVLINYLRFDLIQIKGIKLETLPQVRGQFLGVKLLC